MRRFTFLLALAVSLLALAIGAPAYATGDHHGCNPKDKVSKVCVPDKPSPSASQSSAPACTPEGQPVAPGQSACPRLPHKPIVKLPHKPQPSSSSAASATPSASPSASKSTSVVKPQGSGSGPQLPLTGPAAPVIAGVSSVLLLLGISLIVTARRRRTVQFKA